MFQSTPYQHCVRHAAAQGEGLIKSLIETARHQIYQRAGTATDIDRHNDLLVALRLLNQHERSLCRSFPDLLLTEFMTRPVAVPQPGVVTNSWIDFDQLELMDDMQVQERVEVARIQQAVIQATEVEISELNRLICGAQGLDCVYADRNPMRPEVYARTLRTALLQTLEALPVRLIWMQFMGETLGRMLAETYRDLSRMLRQAGVMPAAYSVTHNAAGHRMETSFSDAAAGSAHGGLQWIPGEMDSPPPDEKLLTLGQLRRLLAGELTPENQAIQQVGLRRAGPMLEFSQTVPAAFEVLQEMAQVDTVMKRLADRQRRSLLPDDPFFQDTDASLLRAQFRQEAHGLGQTLGLEVVTLMVDNMASDARLLAPVREAVLTLEPALLRLALKDPRFFSDRQHAARRLLEEITQRSLGFDSVEAEGFGAFIQPVQGAVDALALIGVEGAEPFEMALGALQEDWARHASREKERHEKAVQALLLIEKRNLLAGKISRSLRARADVQRAPFEVVEMLLGPWSQVLAQAHLNSPADTGDPGALGALVSDLLWSVNVELAGADENRLIKQIPGLLRKLRQGLESIDFPAARINEFLRFLTGLHQQILQPAAQPRGAADFSMSSAALKSHFDQADMAGVWLVGEEARDSGFLDALPVMDAGVPMLPTSARADRDFRFAVQPGAWVELLIQKKWVRAQLTWASPQGTLYMFTSVSGGTHSMTCRSFERLCKEGTARLIASQALLDGALDAVAQTALRNSLDIRP